MNERILEAIKTLKKHQDLLQDSLKEINDKLKKLEDYKDYNESTIDDIQKSMMDASLEIGRYSIIDGEWCCYGKPMGVKAIGIDGKDGKQGLQGIPGKDGKDGKPGKDGKDGKNGIDGKNGTDGKDGKPGIDGKDGEAPIIRIGKVESSEENGGAKAVLRRKKGTNEYILDLTLPRGPRGFAGFDGKPGKDATGVDIDLSEYVKNTDYATSSEVGVVKANGSGGITVNSAGNISVVKATNNDIDGKTNNYKAIVPSNLEYAVKSVGDGYYATVEQIGDIEALLKEV